MDQLVNEVCRQIASVVPLESFRTPNYHFLHRAFVGMLLIGPLCSTVGIQVVNFRMAFFAEAVGHSAFTGIALGLVLLALLPTLNLDPIFAMIGFGVLVACLITLYRRRTSLPSDTVIGVISASVMAFGLCLLTYLLNENRGLDQARFNSFLTGNILKIQPAEIALLAGFFLLAMAFEIYAYNRLMFLSLNSDLAETLGIHVGRYEYSFAVLLTLVVMFSIKAIGVLLVTAMLVIPAAAARNLAHSAGGLFWWGLVIATSSSVGGLIIADTVNTAAGSTAVLCAAGWFLISNLYAWLAGKH